MEKKTTRTLNNDSMLALTLREKAAELTRAADELVAKTRLARGTRDNVKPLTRASEYHVGNEGPTAELLEVVKTMLTGHARTFREILDATGAGDNRIKGVLMRMQREGVNLVNVGTDTRALWTIMSPEAYARIRAAMEAKRRMKR